MQQSSFVWNWWNALQGTIKSARKLSKTQGKVIICSTFEARESSRVEICAQFPSQILLKQTFFPLRTMANGISCFASSYCILSFNMPRSTIPSDVIFTYKRSGTTSLVNFILTEEASLSFSCLWRWAHSFECSQPHADYRGRTTRGLLAPMQKCASECDSWSFYFRAHQECRVYKLHLVRGPMQEENFCQKWLFFNAAMTRIFFTIFSKTYSWNSNATPFDIFIINSVVNPRNWYWTGKSLLG